MARIRKRRPHQNKKVTELRELVQGNRSNKQVLNEVLHELEFRRTPSAAELGKSVSNLLGDDPGNSYDRQLTLLPQDDSGARNGKEGTERKGNVFPTAGTRAKTLGSETESGDPTRPPGLERSRSYPSPAPPPTQAGVNDATNHESNQPRTRHFMPAMGQPDMDLSTSAPEESEHTMSDVSAASTPASPGSGQHLEEDFGRRRITRVFSFLKALNELRTPTTRQVTDSPWHHWLGDVPRCEEVVFGPWKEQGRADAPNLEEPGSGDTVDDFILRVERPKLVPAPNPPKAIKGWMTGAWEDPNSSPSHREEMLEETGEDEEPAIIRFSDDLHRVRTWSEWLDRWRSWARSEQPRRKASQLFEKLHSLHSLFQREGERYELLVGDGILSWTVRSGSIFYPLIARPLYLEFNPNVPSFSLRETGAASVFQDSVFRGVEEASQMQKILGEYRERIHVEDIAPLGGGDTSRLLEALPAELDARGRYLDHELPPGGVEASHPIVGRHPVLLVRPRLQGYGRFIKKLVESLSTDEVVPDSLRRLVGDFGTDQPFPNEPKSQAWEEPADLLLSKPANPAQIRVARTLAKQPGVLVQGPPGTGKSHTIGNLIGDLLASGKSVLVTSNTSKALRVLRDKVEKELQPLCVSVLDSDAESRAMLDSSIQSIANRLDSVDLQTLEVEAGDLGKERTRLLADLAASQKKLMEARGLEGKPLKLDEEELSPLFAAKFVHRTRDECGWIPAGVERGAKLPLTATEVGELYHTNTVLAPGDEAELASGLPPIEDMVSPDDYERREDQRVQLRQERDIRFDSFWDRPASMGEEGSLSALAKELVEEAEALNAESEWVITLLSAGSHDSDRKIWSQMIYDLTQDLEVVDRTKPTTFRYSIELPEDRSLWPEFSAVLAHVEAGGGLGWLTLVRRRAWKAVIEATAVDGSPPETAKELSAAQDAILYEEALASLRTRWKRHWDGEDPVDPSYLNESTEKALREWLPRIETHLNWFVSSWGPLHDRLLALGFSWEDHLERTRKPETSGVYDRDFLMHFRDAFSSLIQAVEARCQASTLARIDHQHDELQRSLKEFPASNTREALTLAVYERDPIAYRAAYEQLKRLQGLGGAFAIRRDRLDKLAPVARKWAEAIRLRQGLHGDGKPPGSVQEAWRWIQISEELDFRSEANLDLLQRRVVSLRQQARRTTTKLIDRKAWAHQVRRSSGAPKQALMGYRKVLNKIGAGTGKRAPRLKKEARSLMVECRKAVPVWIMPMSRVVDSFDPSQTQFDVVIVDEASQTDVMGLLAFYIGRKVLIVGDEEQVSPDAVGQKLDQVQELIDSHLEGVPNAALYDGNTSIYDLAGTSFGAAIRLVEHFRCVPDIISFSNHLSYNGDIQPLREASDTLLSPPTIVHRVEDGVRRDGSKENPTEAIQVASLVAAAIEMPEYAGKTMGVISLVGQEQALLVDNHLRKHVPLDQYARHQILCGSSAQFQGDERHVMFLSVVDSPQETGQLPLRRSGARDMYKKRFNVATSRAQDQMWVVHSLDPQRDLQPQDLRLRLIQHAEDPAAVDRDIDRAHALAESQFEKDVGQGLIQQGFRIEPQVRVGRFRLDLVVSDGRNRVAIECDGDRYHGLEQLAKDMERQAILERLGWRFIRIRGSQFYRDPRAEMEAVRRRLDELEIQPSAELTERRQSISDLYERVVARAAALRSEWGV